MKEMDAAKKGFSEISRVTGHSRQTVYKILGKWTRKRTWRELDRAGMVSFSRRRTAHAHPATALPLS